MFFMRLSSVITPELKNMFASAGFSIYPEDENCVGFQKYSSAGQDFNFSIDTENNLYYFANNILAYYQDFDVSAEAMLWLGPDGHGRNGAPYDMQDVYKDMEECEAFIYEAYQIVNSYIDNILDCR